MLCNYTHNHTSQFLLHVCIHSIVPASMLHPSHVFHTLDVGMGILVVFVCPVLPAHCHPYTYIVSVVFDSAIPTSVSACV